MPRFVQFLQHSGVFAEQDFMIVPRGGFNLVCLRDSKDVRLSYDRGRLQVDDVGLEHVERVAQEYINTRYGKQKSQERDDQLLRLRTGLFGTARPDGLARGLKVSAKGVGLPELKGTRGNIGVRLDVAILPRKEFTIAFKFLRHLDPSGKVINATRWTPDHVPWFLTRLNWTFGAQAKSFSPRSKPRGLRSRKPWGQKSRAMLSERTSFPSRGPAPISRAFSSATMTQWIPRRPGNICLIEQVFVVVDEGNPPVFDLGEAFIGVMAHKIGHFLHHKRSMPGSGHHGRGGILLSSGMESLSLDKQLVSNFNAW